MSEVSEKKSVNLSTAKYLMTADLNVLIPGTADPSGWIVTFAGPAHDKTKALADKSTREAQKKQADIERSQVNGRKWKGEELTPDEVRRKTVESIVGRIVGWSPDPDFGNGPVPFDDEKAVDLFMDQELGAFFSQFVDFLLSEKAFLKVSAKG